MSRGPGLVEGGFGEQIVKQRRSDEVLIKHRRADGVQLSTVELYDISRHISLIRHILVT